MKARTTISADDMRAEYDFDYSKAVWGKYLKVLARDDRTRPQDRADLHALLSRAGTAGDVADARAILALVRARGFHRGRDLEREFTRVAQELA